MAAQPAIDNLNLPLAMALALALAGIACVITGAMIGARSRNATTTASRGRR